MAARITAAQSEVWKNHRFVDEEKGESWEGYQQNLFIGSERGQINQDLDEVLKSKPKLLSSLNNAEYLDEISAPMDAAKLSRSQKVKKGKRKGKGKEKAIDGAESDTLDAISDPSLSDTEEEDDAPPREL